MNTTIKYVATIAATTALTVTWVYAWAGLTASSGDKLDYQKWNQLVNTVQSGRIPGEIAAFNLSSCPTGWTEYTAAAGRTVIGRGNGAGSNTSVGDVGWDKSKPQMIGAITVDTSGLTVNSSLNVWTSVGTSLIPASNGYLVGSSAGPTSAAIYTSTIPGSTVPLNGVTSSIAGSITATMSNAGGTAPDNMQPYVALLYCQKN